MAIVHPKFHPHLHDIRFVEKAQVYDEIVMDLAVIARWKCRFEEMGEQAEEWKWRPDRRVLVKRPVVDKR